MLRVLNDGIRPHLTKWQSKYRKWWNEAVEATDKRGISPQDIQRKFPEYDAIVNDLKEMNVELAVFADELRAIARREKQTRRRKQRIAPIAPSS